MKPPGEFSWYPYIPPLFALYLMGMSYFSSLYAKRLIASDNARAVAEDWAARIGAINGMVSSLVSLYSIFETSKSFGLLTLCAIVLTALFVPMLWWLVSLAQGELYLLRVPTPFGNFFGNHIVAAILVVVNMLLMLAIFLNQQSTAQH